MGSASGNTTIHHTGTVDQISVGVSSREEADEVDMTLHAVGSRRQYSIVLVGDGGAAGTL